MKQKPITATELMKQLKNDPEYQEHIRKRDEELRPILVKRKKDEEALVSEIRAVGYEIDSVYDLVNNDLHPFLKRNFIGSYKKAYPILLEHLKIPHERAIREGIIRALTEKDVGREVQDELFRQFGLEEHAETKWVLANALRTVMPYHRRKKHPEIKETLYKTEQMAARERKKRAPHEP